MPSPLTDAQVWEALNSIADPEIPVVSLVELGMIGTVGVSGGEVRVGLRPTFAGCPALEVMQREIRDRLTRLGARKVSIELTLQPPWSTDDILPEARSKLAAFGLAPAPGPVIHLDEILAAPRPCVHCGSTDTEVRNEFGATPCRTILYCRACNQPFEGMKPV
jgi:ring-1,2-phenylacetyl-CoA epoxidase subunit PaaD